MSAGAFDTFATGARVGNDPLTANCGATATLAQAAEVAFVLHKSTIANASTGWANGTGWSTPTTQVLNANAILEQQITAATTALTEQTGVWTPGGVASDTLSSLLVTYKGAGGAAVVIPQPGFEFGFR